MRIPSLIFVLCFCCSIVHAQKPTMNEHLFDMEGTWTVLTKTMTPQGKWIEGKPTKSTVKELLDRTFLVEDVIFAGPDMTITMHLIFGIDPRSGKYRVIALDKEFGTMDVYEGDWQDNKLTVNNLKDEGFKMQDGTVFHYRLTYALDSKDRRTLEVDFTGDGGENWKSYQKIEYSRQK